MRISVVGLGKLGAPMLGVLASRGYDVVGIDANPEMVDKMNRHIAPVEEPGLQELLTQNKDRISATTNWNKAVAETDITTIIVPTPSGADGTFRNDHVLSAIDEIGRVLASKPGYHLVVVNSTTMPGSVGGPIRQLLEQSSGRKVGPDLGLCYNPEFIALGDVINGLLHPDFVLIGESDKKAGDLLEGVQRQTVGPQANIARMNFVNAELTKISVNTYVTMKISFANMLGEICDRLESADASVVVNAVGRDSRIGKKYLKPAVGYGGPCFPRDTVAFARMAELVHSRADLALATDAINRRQVRRLTDLIHNIAPTGAVIAVLGLSYKPDTSVVEESQGIILGKVLADAGYKVLAHDPLALGSARAVLGTRVTIAASAEEAVNQSDVIAVMTPWPEYAAISPRWLEDDRRHFIIDCWGQLDPTGFPDHCKVLRPGQQETVAAAATRVPAE